MDVRALGSARKFTKVHNNLDHGYLNIFIAGVFFGTVGLFTIPMAALGVDPMTTAFMRLGSGAIILTGIVVAKKGISAFRVSWRTMIVCVVLGILFNGLHNLCYLEAIVMSGVTTSAVLVRVAPIVTAFLSAVLFKEHISKMKGLALALNVVGCVLAVFSTDLLAGGGNWVGILLGIGAGVTYGYLPIIMSFVKEDVDPMVINAYGFAFGAIFMCFVAKPWNCPEAFTMPALGLGLLFGLIPSGIGYSIYYKGVSQITENSKIPIVVSIEVVVAAVIGSVLFGDSISLINLFGFFVLLVSIIFMSKAN